MENARNPAPGAGSARDAALTRMALTYRDALGRFFARRVREPADVPDLVQEVFLRLSRLPDPAAVEKPEHFLFVTAANVLKDRARRATVRGQGLHDSIADHQIESSEISADRVLASRAMATRLRAVLAELPERRRDVFVLRVLEGMKMADVARALSISTRAAEKHQAKALAHVAAALEGWRDS